MDARALVLRSLDYDRWANLQWVGAIGTFKDLMRAHLILEHMLGASRIWLERCGVELRPAEDDSSLQSLFEDVANAWRYLIESQPLDTQIPYNNLAGQPFVNTLGEIVLHVINHGTYHRGQLRGLAMAEGVTNFPETDLILFYREFGVMLPEEEPHLSEATPTLN